ncbi:MAG: hypothetical protein WC113_03355 [Candidatus Paceibacterota bacterium]|jgi:DNA-binding beta-propeller fold protein YncE
MRSFELYFNPQVEDGLTFETYCFEPETSQEKELGSLYLAGSMAGSGQKTKDLLGEMAASVKDGYYRSPGTDRQESFREALRQANSFLAETADDSFSVNFFILSSKGRDISFSQLGDGIKAVFWQDGKLSEANYGSSKNGNVFKKIVSGEIREKDSVMILSGGVLDFFLRKGILDKIASYENFREVEKSIDKIKKETSSLSGFLLLLRPEKDISCQRIVAEDKPLKKAFSLRLRQLPFLKNYKILWPKLPISPDLLKNINIPAMTAFLSSKKTNCQAAAKWMVRKIYAIKEKSAKISFRAKDIRLSSWEQRRNILNVILLIVVLLIGFNFSQVEKKKSLELALKEINQIEQKVSQANLLIKQGKTKDANLLFQEALDQISLKIGQSKAANQEAQQMKEEIEKKLYSLNKFNANAPFETISDQLNTKTTLIPNSLIYNDGKFYIFNPNSEKILIFDPKNKDYQTASYSANLAFGKSFDKGQLIFLDGQNQLVILKGKEFQRLDAVSFPYPQTTPLDFELFSDNIYILGKRSSTKEIIKYGYLENYKWNGPEIWLEKADKESVSIAVDGLLWVIGDNNSLKTYYAGKFQNEFDLKFFPSPKYISKIIAPSNSSYIYLLDTDKKRVVILNKSGSVIKQVQNDQWGDLLDLAVSPDGKTAYLLNGVRILKVDLGL